MLWSKAEMPVSDTFLLNKKPFDYILIQGQSTHVYLYNSVRNDLSSTNSLKIKPWNIVWFKRKSQVKLFI